MKIAFTVLTYNIHKGFAPARLGFMLPKMREALKAQNPNPDLVFLQEVQGQHTRRQQRIAAWPLMSQCEFLAKEGWPHYAYAKNAVYEAGHHGNAILSKYPIVSWENINVATLSRASRSLLHCIIALPGNNPPHYLHAICIHLGVFKVERHIQVQTLTQRLREEVPMDEPLILAGDFNEWRKEAFEDLEQELALLEAFKVCQGTYARTFPAIRPTLPIDRIYYRGLEVENAECLDTKPWRLLSDHLPLLARFELEV